MITLFVLLLIIPKCINISKKERLPPAINNEWSPLSLTILSLQIRNSFLNTYYTFFLVAQFSEFLVVTFRKCKTIENYILLDFSEIIMH